MTGVETVFNHNAVQIEKEENKKEKKIVVVGAGLVGSLQALYFAQRSYNVSVYEYRSDPRTEADVAGRSINLALSKRGREALKGVGAEEHVVKTGIPMHSRMIHSHDGTRTPIPYGTKDQYILSIDRRKLNEHLISLVEKHPNVEFHFDAKCTNANIKETCVTFQQTRSSMKPGEDSTKPFDVEGDLIVGCDGSFSGIRKQLMKLNRMNYSQVWYYYLNIILLNIFIN